MSKKWWVVVGVAFVVGCVAIGLGFLLPDQNSFLQNLTAEAAGLAFSLAVVVLLIEGPLLTRERRLRKVIAMAARSVAELNAQIAHMLVREIGEYLAGSLDSNVDLYGKERGDWAAFKPLLRQIFQDARKVPANGLPKKNVSLNEENYQGYVKEARRFVDRVRGALGSNWEVQAQLLELVEVLNKLDTCITKANWPSTIRDEKMRYEALGNIGDAIIAVVEATPQITL